MSVSVSVRKYFLNTSEETEETANKLAKQIHAPAVIFLEGSLGTGKTTFVRGFLKGCGFTGHVKSPTFTLIETYAVQNKTIIHADLYRLKNLAELDNIGFRDYFTQENILLIEWANIAKEVLPSPTLICTFTIADNDQGRWLEIDNGREQ